VNDHLLQAANWIVVGCGIVLGVLVIAVLLRVLRRTSSRRTALDDVPRAANSSNDQQFMLATFQGVIQQQKEQERELDRLRQMEKERADLSQNINENITRNMPTGLITIDRSGIVSSSNPAAKEILQRKLFERMLFTEVLPAAGTFVPMVESCLQTGRRFHRVEIEVALGSNQHKTLGISMSPIKSAKDEILGVVCLISDLTELAALQKQVRLKEGLVFLGEMSAGIAHEFKNSLATISGYVQLVGDDALTPAVENSLKMIRKETSQLTSTINKFLNFAKPQQLNRQALNLGQLLRDSLDEIRRDVRFQHIEYLFEGNARVYGGDESLLRSVFNNLLLNASDSIEPDANGGQVSCTLLDLVGDRSHKMLVKISDNGCGISSEDLQRIFIPFFTSKSSGSGLGLAIVQKIVLMHDGRIELESKPGEGTCVNVYL
jgi:signal transduction histidine kinase